MKTAVSLPDALFREAESVAESLDISRSELYARALADFVGRLRAGEVRESYDRAYGEPEAPAEAAFRRRAARRIAGRSDW